MVLVVIHQQVYRKKTLMEIQELSPIIIHVFEMVAAILATIHYKKYKNSIDKYFLFFLWYVVITEAVGWYYGHILEINNVWIYNIYIIISYLFFINWYYSILKSNTFKNFVMVLGFAFISVALYNSFTQDWKYYLYITFIAGVVAVLISTLLFFSELLNGDEVLELKKNLRFWIATGMLLFSVGMVPLIIFSRIFQANNEMRLIILMILNIILYSCYSFGFIWSKPRHKTFS